MENIKVLYMNGTVVNYSSIVEFKSDYNILNSLDYSKINKIIVAPSPTGYYKYLKIIYKNAKVEWFRQVAKGNNYKKYNVEDQEINNVCVDNLGNEKKLINLVLDNKDVVVYYKLKQKELDTLENKINNIGYSKEAIEKLKKNVDGAETIEDFIDNLKYVVENKYNNLLC